MTFLKSFFLNFLIVFFVNRVIPGIEVSTFETVPDVIADFFFSAVLGFLNASVVYILMIFSLNPTIFKMGLFTFILSFGAFALTAAFPLGIDIHNFGGYFFASLIVWLIAFFSNYMEKAYAYRK